MSKFETKISYFPGPPAELLEMFGISASSIVAACNEIIKQWIAEVNPTKKVGEKVLYMCIENIQ